MLALAYRSLRTRVGGFASSFVAVFLGAAILMAFASMLDTRSAHATDKISRSTLLIVAVVVGGWGLLIVAFGIASTLTLSVRQRARELALLKSVGATPAQVRRLVVQEAALVSLAAAAAAVPAAVLVGWGVLALLRETGQVAKGVGYSFGPVALGMGLGITFLSATIAASVAARRAATMRPADSLLTASLDEPRTSRKRVVFAGVFLLISLNTGIATVAVFKGKGIQAMETAGQGSICAAIGFALLAPYLIRRISTRIASRVERLGASGYVAALNVRQRTQQTASALIPIILFTGIALGTFYMQSIENGARAGTRHATLADAKNIETLNYVIVGLIGVFAAIMLINTIFTATIFRRQEFAQLRLAGSTRFQVLAIVSIESFVLLVTGVLFGSIAAVFTVVPYSIARTNTILPLHSGAPIYLAVVSAAIVLTLASTLAAARRSMRMGAVEAVSAQ